jgi:hypothetical protein
MSCLRVVLHNMGVLQCVLSIYSYNRHLQHHQYVCWWREIHLPEVDTPAGKLWIHCDVNVSYLRCWDYLYWLSTIHCDSAGSVHCEFIEDIGDDVHELFIGGELQQSVHRHTEFVLWLVMWRFSVDGLPSSQDLLCGIVPHTESDR